MRRSTGILPSLLLPAIGSLMLIGTLLWGAWVGYFTAWMLGMGGCALAIVVLGLLWQERGSTADTTAMIMTCLFAILSGVFLYMIVANHSQRIDLTKHRLHTLSDQTRSFLRGLESPIKITVFADSRDIGELRTFLRLYEQESPLVAFEIHDPTMEPAVASNFGTSVIAGDAFAMAYEDGREVRRQRFRVTAGDQYRERAVSNALLQLERGGARRLYFTRGHQERGLERAEGQRREDRDMSLRTFALFLEQRVMPLGETSLMTLPRVPDDAAAVMIVGPNSDLLDVERELLIDYLDDGGALFVAIDPVFGISQLTNLEAVLAHAGIEAPNRFVVDRLGQPAPHHAIAIAAGDHAIVRDMSQPVFVMEMARPLDAAADLASRSDIRLEGIVQTHEQVWTMTPDELRRQTGRASEPSSPDEVRPRYMGLISTFATPRGSRSETARVVVFGDSDFLVTANLTRDEPLIVALNAVNWLVDREDQLAIPPKLIPPSSFMLTQKRLWLIVGSLLLIGVAIVAMGVGGTLARRRMG